MYYDFIIHIHNTFTTMVYKDIFIILAAFIFTKSVSTLLCYDCNSFEHGHEKCGRTSTLTRHNTEHILECSGYCKIATFSKGSIYGVESERKTDYKYGSENYGFCAKYGGGDGNISTTLRMCDVNATDTGCQEVVRGSETRSLCICKHNYCNIDLHNSKSPSVVSLASMTSDSPPRWTSVKVLSSLIISVVLQNIFDL